MTNTNISHEDNHTRKFTQVRGMEMAYVDMGEGDPVVFLHGNPTSSYLWRNIMPHVAPVGRCIAPDLIGMGDSAKIPGSMYRFVDHRRYLDALLEQLGVMENTIIVGHDWGSALGFHWAQRYHARVKGRVYLEALVRPFPDDGPPNAQGEKISTQQRFQEMRSEKGESMILQDNYFVEERLPSRVLRKLTEEVMVVYRKPYLIAGEDRRPTLTWPREVSIGGEPKDVTDITASYSQWLRTTNKPKLLIAGEPGGLIHGEELEFCRTFPNQTEITVPGIHFLQEDAPHEIGEAIRDFAIHL